jgi:hypothetical protein
MKKDKFLLGAIAAGLDKISRGTHSAVPLETNTATVRLGSTIATIGMLIAATDEVNFTPSFISKY